ncbi:hypothetical protein ACIBJI_41215 [Nocardia sp. NPDC050408]|uniref:hypothetical protein n=1 Tax=Nocardia sp. NPDC050408 TaxID=3364319 RepID=UPI003799BE85
MGTMTITINTPAVGYREEGSDNGSFPSDEQMREEKAARDKVLQSMVPFLQSLPNLPPRRAGNAFGLELLGARTWSNLHKYLLLLDVDTVGGGLADELATVLPSGSSVSVVGDSEPLETSQPSQA